MPIVRGMRGYGSRTDTSDYFFGTSKEGNHMGLGGMKVPYVGRFNSWGMTRGRWVSSARKDWDRSKLTKRIRATPQRPGGWCFWPARRGDYFRKAGKSLDFREKFAALETILGIDAWVRRDQLRSWLVLVNEYADSVFSSIFQAIGDRRASLRRPASLLGDARSPRPWLDQVDFILVLDAGIKAKVGQRFG